MPYKPRITKNAGDPNDRVGQLAYKRGREFEQKFTSAYVASVQRTVQELENEVRGTPIRLAAESRTTAPIMARLSDDMVAGMVDVHKVSDKRVDELLELLITEMLTKKGELEFEAIMASLGEPTRGGIGFKFDLQNPYSLPWIKSYRLRNIRDLTDATRRSIKLALEDAVRDQLTVDQLAINLQDAVGLTAAQSRGLRKFRSGLVAAGESPSRIARLVKARRARLIKERGRLIARTEVNRVQNQGKLHAWKAARDEGLLEPDVKRRWVASPFSPRTECICRSLHRADPVGLDEFFVSEFGEFEAPPAHPACRCTQVLVLEEENGS